MLRASLICLLGMALLILFSQVRAPAQFGPIPKTDPNEINIVLRLSRKVVAELTTKTIQRTDPIHLYAFDAPIDGTAWTDATFRVQFDTNAKESAFTLELRGTTTASTSSESSYVQVFGSSVMRFVARQRVTFDGLKYRAEPTLIDSTFSASVDGLMTPKGIFGSIVKCIALPEIRRRHPPITHMAFEEAKTQLTEEFDREAKKLLDSLNQVSPLQETAAALFPETRDWIYYLSTTPTHLIGGFGPRDRRVPELPITDKTQAPIELWIRGKQETLGMLKVMKLWKDAGKQLDTLLPGELGKLLKGGESFKTLNVKEWVVIQLGFGNQKEQQINEPGPTPKILPPGGLDIPGSEPGSTPAASAPPAVLWRPVARPPDPQSNEVWRPVAAPDRPSQIPSGIDSTPVVLPRQ